MLEVSPWLINSLIFGFCIGMYTNSVWLGVAASIFLVTIGDIAWEIRKKNTKGE